MLEVILAPKGIMVLSLHVLFLALALRRVWCQNAASLPAKIFWSILAVIIPVIGPIMAMGFGRVPRPHGESTPPTRSWMGDSWTGGWR